MGEIYSVTCKNKNCRYHTHLRTGTGMLGYAKIMEFRERILSNETSHPAVAERLKNGAELVTNGIYLCPKCKEFTNNNTYFLLDNFTESPFGTIRYDVVFPFENPICDVCNSDLVYIKNICSSKVKCPKCDSMLNARKIGYTD